MKKKTKIARGEVVYKYKGRYVLEPPSNCYRKCMYYNDELNRTEIVFKKHGILIELLCSVVLVFLVLIKILNVGAFNTINYDSTPDYYNGILYLNIKSGVNNSTGITVELLDGDEVILRKHLSSGDELLEMPIDDVKVEYMLRVKERGGVFDNEYVRRLCVNNIDTSVFYTDEYTE